MNIDKLNIVILCGGSGKRLFPLSTEERPKQFLKILPHNGTYISLIEKTIIRCKNIVHREIYCLTDIKYKNNFDDLVTKYNIKLIFEPAKKGTTSAITLALRELNKFNEDPVLFVPSDHFILADDEFSRSIQKSVDNLNSEIIIYGIEASYPETGFGYIQINDQLSDNLYSLECFKEKPNYELAIKYVQQNKSKPTWFFNSGMILSKVEVLLDEIKVHCPFTHPYILSGEVDDYLKLDEVAIDIALLEKTKNIRLWKTDALGWNDIGSWKSYYEILSPQNNTNNLVISDQSKIISSKNNLVINHSPYKINLLGLENIGVIVSDNEILVLNLDYSQKVKDLV